MRRTLFESLMVLVCLGVFSVGAYAQSKEHVSIEVNYLGGDMREQSDYAPEHFSSGETHEANGFQLAVEVPINKNISTGGHWEESFLRQGKFFESSHFRHSVDEDRNETSARSRYGELYASVALPKMIGFRAIAGVAAMRQEQSREFQLYFSLPPVPEPPEASSQGQQSVTINAISSHKAIAVGPMIGLEWSHEVNRRFSLLLAGRGYPRLSQTDRYSFQTGSGFMPSNEGSNSSTSSGFEGRAIATYQVAKHVGLNFGYQLRRIYEGWNRTDTDKGLIVGTKFTF